MRCCAMGRRLVLDEAATLAFDPVDRLVKGSWCSGRRAMTTIAGPASASGPDRSPHGPRFRPAETLRTASAYLNQMRWYSRLMGWRSRATRAPSNIRLMIAVEVSTELPNTARSMTTWNTAPATATA